MLRRDILDHSCTDRLEMSFRPRSGPLFHGEDTWPVWDSAGSDQDSKKKSGGLDFLGVLESGINQDLEPKKIQAQ